MCWYCFCNNLQIVDAHTVDVDGKLYSAKHILVSVGGRPFIPDIPGKEYAIDSDAALDLPSKPQKIAIVGGGYIALEFAGIFNGLKSEVHVFIRQKKVLRGFDEEVSNHGQYILLNRYSVLTVNYSFTIKLRTMSAD